MSITSEFMQNAIDVAKPVAAGLVGGLFIGGMLGNHGAGMAIGLGLGAICSAVECYRQERGRRVPPPVANQLG